MNWIRMEFGTHGARRLTGTGRAQQLHFQPSPNTIQDIATRSNQVGNPIQNPWQPKRATQTNTIKKAKKERNKKKERNGQEKAKKQDRQLCLCRKVRGITILSRSYILFPFPTFLFLSPPSAVMVWLSRRSRRPLFSDPVTPAHLLSSLYSCRSSKTLHM